MKSETVKLPAFLASALVNGDTSGLTCSCGERERAEIQRRDEGPHDPQPNPRNHGGCDFAHLAAAIAYCAPGRIVSAEGESYFSSCGGDLPGFNLGCDVLDYVVLYPKG